MRSPISVLRGHVLVHAARVLIKSGTFRQHLGALDPTFDPNFLRAASLIKNATDDEALFVRDLVSNTKSFAQLNQDLWVLHETKRKRNGYFVEFGATDGISLSNTYLLERDFDWRGILAEPNPTWHTDLTRNRMAEIDFRCTGEHVQFAATKYPGLGTILGFESNDGHQQSRRDRSLISAATVSLDDLLEQHNAPRDIDYISVDTEGSELEILEHFNFKRWNVTLFSIEHNLTEKEKILDRLMQRHGYERRYPSISQFDAWYKKRLADRKEGASP